MENVCLKLLSLDMGDKRKQLYQSITDTLQLAVEIRQNAQSLGVCSNHNTSESGKYSPQGVPIVAKIVDWNDTQFFPCSCTIYLKMTISFILSTRERHFNHLQRIAIVWATKQ